MRSSANVQMAMVLQQLQQSCVNNAMLLNTMSSDSLTTDFSFRLTCHNP